MKGYELTESKLKYYKTCFAPIYNEYMKIEKVRQDDVGEYLIDCRGSDGKMGVFRVNELTKYCL